MTDNALKIIKDELERINEIALEVEDIEPILVSKALSVAVTKLGETYPGEYGAIFKASNDEALKSIADLLSGGKDVNL